MGQSYPHPGHGACPTPSLEEEAILGPGPVCNRAVHKGRPDEKVQERWHQPHTLCGRADGQSAGKGGEQALEHHKHVLWDFGCIGVESVIESEQEKVVKGFQ